LAFSCIATSCSESLLSHVSSHWSANYNKIQLVIAKCLLRIILCMKASQLTRRRSSRGSNFNCWSRALTLVFWSFEQVITSQDV